MKRIGLIIPHTDTTLETDLQARATRIGGSLHSARVWLERVTVEAEERMLEVEVPRAASYLRALEPDVVVFGCTSAGAIRGVDGEADFRAWLTQELACPVVSAFASVCNALISSNDSRTHVVTPYVRPVHESLLDSLRAAGVELRDGGCMGYDDDVVVGRLRPVDIARFVRDQVRLQSGGESLFLSCTNLRAAECAEAISWFSDCRVTSSNLAIMQELESVLANHGR